MNEMFSEVKYKHGSAYFSINRENPGIYLARLVHYSGRKSEAPPSEISLIRGIRYWTGSCEDKALLNQLGKTIEDSYTKTKVKEF
jgi:hypothetical protein